MAFTLRLREDLEQELETFCDRNGCSKSWLVGRALEHYFVMAKHSEKVSHVDAVVHKQAPVLQGTPLPSREVKTDFK